MHRFEIYLVHITTPGGAVFHYVGLTRSGRRAERLAEHAAGKGSQFIARVAPAGSVLVSIPLTSSDSPDAEKKIKAKHRNRAFCPICNPDLPTPPKEQIFTDVTRPARHARPDDWGRGLKPWVSFSPPQTKSASRK